VPLTGQEPEIFKAVESRVYRSLGEVEQPVRAFTQMGDDRVAMSRLCAEDGQQQQVEMTFYLVCTHTLAS
jgi:hypothetical protein